MLNKQPYLSVVVTARNDTHGGNLLGRMQAFVNAWIGQAKRHGLSSELIVVDWNPPKDRPPLIEAISWPADTGPCQVRFIQVPAEIHNTYQHPAALPLYQMIAKNVAMRRSRGRFILATNIDIIFSDEAVRFFAEEQLLPGRMYRMDRHDVMPDVPVDGSVGEQLEYCGTHIIRVCAREGYFELTPDGLRRLSPNDIAAQDSGIYFGDGWYSIEQYSPQERFRWVDNDAQVVVDLPTDPAPPLIFDLEPGPGVGRQPFRLQVCDAADNVVAETIVAQRLRLELQLPGGSRRVTFRLHVPMGGAPKSDDPRIMNFRVFSCCWAERRSSEAEVPKPHAEILAEVRPEQEVYELTAQPLKLSLLKRALRFCRDSGGPVRAARAAMLHHSRSRLLIRKAPLGHDVFDTVNGIAPGAGWYELEHFRGETFRWTNGDASELIVSAPDEKAARLGIQIEPGPGVGSAAFELLVQDESGGIVARTLVERLRYTEIPLPCKPSCTQVFSLSAVGCGRPCPNGDPRILNFRVYWCGWAGTSQQQDPALPAVAPREAISRGFQWGHGWSAPQVTESGQPYREGRTGAEILLCPPTSQATGVFLEVEPIPGNPAFTLEFRDSRGRTMAVAGIDSHKQLHIPLPLRAKRTAVLTLCVAGEARSAVRFRVFRWAWSTAVLEPPPSPQVAAVTPPWQARIVSSEGDVVEASSTYAAPIRSGSNAAFLHTNTCGDFTLMAREDWFELRGYPEFDLYSFNIDSVLCYAAHHAGFREEMLRDPMRCYHIEHGLGSGWTPEGQAKLFERLRASGVSWVDYPEVVLWIDQMRRLNSPMIFNLENWGLAGFELPERIVGCLESVQTHT